VGSELPDLERTRTLGSGLVLPLNGLGTQERSYLR